MSQLFPFLIDVSLLRVKILVKKMVGVRTVTVMTIKMSFATITAIMKITHTNADPTVSGWKTCAWPPSNKSGGPSFLCFLQFYDLADCY